MTGLFKRTYDCLMDPVVATKLCAVDALWLDYSAGKLQDDSAAVPVVAVLPAESVVLLRLPVQAQSLLNQLLYLL